MVVVNIVMVVLIVACVVVSDNTTRCSGGYCYYLTRCSGVIIINSSMRGSE